MAMLLTNQIRPRNCGGLFYQRRLTWLWHGKLITLLQWRPFIARFIIANILKSSILISLHNMLPFELTKDTPYLALSGELWSVFFEYYNRNWPCYKGFLLYMNSRMRLFMHAQWMFNPTAVEVRHERVMMMAGWRKKPMHENYGNSFEIFQYFTEIDKICYYLVDLAMVWVSVIS